MVSWLLTKYLETCNNPLEELSNLAEQAIPIAVAMNGDVSERYPFVVPQFLTPVHKVG